VHIHPAQLFGEYYDLLRVIGIKDWDINDRQTANCLGTLARFGHLLADYEMVRRRARPDIDHPGM